MAPRRLSSYGQILRINNDACTFAILGVCVYWYSNDHQSISVNKPNAASSNRLRRVIWNT